MRLRLTPASGGLLLSALTRTQWDWAMEASATTTRLAVALPSPSSDLLEINPLNAGAFLHRLTNKKDDKKGTALCERLTYI